MMKKTTMAALVLAVLGLTSVAHATTTTSTAFQTPVHVQTSMTTSGCDNSPGPQITLQGAMTVGGLGFQLLFENKPSRNPHFHRRIHRHRSSNSCRTKRHNTQTTSPRRNRRKSIHLNPVR